MDCYNRKEKLGSDDIELLICLVGHFIHPADCIGGREPRPSCDGVLTSTAARYNFGFDDPASILDVIF